MAKKIPFLRARAVFREHSALGITLLVPLHLFCEHCDKHIPSNLDWVCGYPYTLILYDRGEVTEAQVVSGINGVGRLSVEVYTFIGIKQIADGDKENGLKHLKWVVEHDSPSDEYYNVARTVLAHEQ